MLGLENSHLNFGDDTHSYKWVLPSTMVNTTGLYIYSDIIEDILVGNVRAKLLRTVPFSSHHSDYNTVTFSKVYYHPVRPGYISGIEIKICDDSGEKINFGPSKTIVVLHFRKCKATPE